MTSKLYFIPNFELRSVGLLAALTVGAALSGHAQTTDSGAVKSPDTQSAPTTQSAAPKSAPTSPDMDAAFTRADTNKDGKLSRQEAARLPAVEQRFDLTDTNKDQSLSREEFEAATKS